MKTYILIQADTNDADYVSNKVLLKNEKELAIIEKVAKAIKEFKPYKSKGPRNTDRDWTHNSNWPTGDACRKDLGEMTPYEIYVDSGKLTEDEFYFFDEMVPYGEHGVHTIEDIELLIVAEERSLL